MPGFVDVTGWTAEEVRRLGHADDADEVYQPRQTWKPKSQSASVQHSVDTVWAAAVVAQRINGSYVKEAMYDYDDNGPKIVKHRNRHIMDELIFSPDRLTQEDIAQGRECREFLQKDITFRALKGQLTDFDTATSKVLAVNTEFDTVKHKFELAVVASLPASRDRALARQATQERMRQTTGDYVDAVGAKVTLNVEIVRSNYSQQWNTWYATGITSTNQAVFFAYRAELAPGSTHTIQGTVKAHRDGSTQLNRVSIK